MKYSFRTDGVEGAMIVIVEPEEDPSWRLKAACRGIDPKLFFPEVGEMQTYVKDQVCGPCPVRADCLEFGLDEDHGLWGGLSVRERKALRRKRNLEQERQ